MKKLVIDPGHGGKDPGAVSNGLKEKDLTLDISNRVASKLSFYDVDVILTRTADRDLSLGERCSIANNHKADYFCSIHINAGGGTGFESFVYTNPSTRTNNIRNIIHDRVADYYKNAGFMDRGKKRANFAVLRETNMPAVLLENLFIDNQKDAAQLKDDSFIDGLAGAIAAGLVVAFGLKLKKKDDGMKVIVKNKELPGKLIDGQTWVPLRELVEALNYKIDWQGADKPVRVE